MSQFWQLKLKDYFEEKQRNGLNLNDNTNKNRRQQPDNINDSNSGLEQNNYKQHQNYRHSGNKKVASQYPKKARPP